jgi:hypothetical protein
MRGIQVAKYVKVIFLISRYPTCLKSMLMFQQGPQELKVTDLPDLKPGPDDYLIEVHAAAANFFDILQIQGKYQNQPRKLLYTYKTKCPSGFYAIMLIGP